MSPYALILISAILNSAWNMSVKPSKDKDSFIFVTIFLSCVLVYGLMLVMNIPFYLGTGLGVHYSILAGVFEGGCLISLAKGYALLPAAKVYSVMRGAAMVMVWVVSLILGLDPFNKITLLGSAIVFLGIIFSSYGQNKIEVKGGELFWPLFGAACICGYHLCYGESLKLGAEPTALFIASLVVSLPFIFFPIRKNFSQKFLYPILNEKKWLFISTLGAAFGFVFFLYGFKQVTPGYSFTLRNSSILFSVLFTYFINDKITRSQVVSALIIGLGVLVMGLGKI